jgi:hypothetical protein
VRIIEKDNDGKETVVYPSTESPPAVAAVAEHPAVQAAQPPAKRKQRPHLDVLIDRAKRRIVPIEKLVDEVRELADIEGPSCGDVADQALAYLRKLVDEMEAARAAGSTGKVTAKSRALAKLRPDTFVRFVSSDLASEFELVYSYDAVVALHVERVIGDYVWLTTGEKSCGRVLWSNVVPIGEETAK